MKILSVAATLVLLTAPAVAQQDMPHINMLSDTPTKTPEEKERDEKLENSLINNYLDAYGGPDGAQTPGMLALRDLLSTLDIPAIEPLPREHVLTKTFYLLREFPGRFNAGQKLNAAITRMTEATISPIAPSRYSQKEALPRTP